MSDEWGPWIEHDGKGCPCVGKFVHVVFDRPGISPDGTITSEEFGIAGQHGGESWLWLPVYTRVIRYRIRKPRGLTILEELLQSLPAPEREGADA